MLKIDDYAFPVWIMLFEADYAKNYASILYQCLYEGKYVIFRRKQQHSDSKVVSINACIPRNNKSKTNKKEGRNRMVTICSKYENYNLRQDPP